MVQIRSNIIMKAPRPRKNFHYHFWDIKTKPKSWSANSIEPGQTARWQRLITFGVVRIRVNVKSDIMCHVNHYLLESNCLSV